MNLGTGVCRLCLAVDVPMRIIVDCPLRNIYEKLMNISLNTAHRPVVACYICYSQLRKCHNLMVRAVIADEVLTQILQSGEIVSGELITMKKGEIQQLNDLCELTPHELIVIAGSQYEPTNANVKEEPMSPQCKQETNTDRRRLVDCFKFEEDVDIGRAVLRDVDGTDNDGLMDEEINNHLENAVDIKEDGLAGSECIKQEETVEKERYVRRCIGYLKFEDSENEEDFDRAVLRDMDSIESDIVSQGDEIENEELETAVNVRSMEATGVAAVEKCKQTHAEKTQNGSAPTPGGKNIREKSERRTVIKEKTISRTIGKYEFRNTKEAVNTGQVSINTSIYSDAAVTESNVRDKDCAGTSTDVDSPRGTRWRKRFVCDECGHTFGNKNVLIKHVGLHLAIKKTRKGNRSHHRTTLSRQTFNKARDMTKKSGKEDSECEIYQGRLLHKAIKKIRKGNKLHRGQGVGVGNKRGKKYVECDICQRIFANKHCLKRHMIIHAAIKPHECDICKLRYFRKDSLKAHVYKTHTREKPYECEICKVRFSRKNDLKVHSMSHTGKEPYECDICKVKFTAKGSLGLHLSIHAGVEHACDICERRFSRKANLERHMRIHKPYKCDVCKVRFTQEDHLKGHLVTHAGEKPLECSICKVKFTVKRRLQQHLSTHVGEKPYECVICRKTFSQAKYLSEHSKLHKREGGPYECRICKMKFNMKYELEGHLITHAREKPYECDICKSRFFHESSLKQHYLTHRRGKPYECDICKKTFAHKSSLSKHITFHIKENPFECHICKVKFTQKDILKQHMIIHTGEKPYACEICPDRLGRKEHLKKHLKSHADKNTDTHTREKPYECEICAARFNNKGHLKTHLRIHTKEKPFECSICKVRFADKSNLRSHVFSHKGEKPYECVPCETKFCLKKTLRKHLKSKRHKLNTSL